MTLASTSRVHFYLALCKVHKADPCKVDSVPCFNPQYIAENRNPRFNTCYNLVYLKFVFNQASAMYCEALTRSFATGGGAVSSTFPARDDVIPRTGSDLTRHA
jgi:hypothetical protein